MKNGQIFTFDVLFAFIGMCCIAVIFFANFSVIVHQTKEDYDSFILQKKLFDSSELLIQNNGKHHELSLGSIKVDKDLQITIKSLSGRVLLREGPESDGLVVRRAAICRGEACVLEIKAKKSA